MGQGVVETTDYIMCEREEGGNLGVDVEERWSKSSSGCRRRSKTLTAGKRRDMGQKHVS